MRAVIKRCHWSSHSETDYEFLTRQDARAEHARKPEKLEYHGIVHFMLPRSMTNFTHIHADDLRRSVSLIVIRWLSFRNAANDGFWRNVRASQSSSSNSPTRISCRTLLKPRRAVPISHRLFDMAGIGEAHPLCARV
jgi:hypothetical protein